MRYLILLLIGLSLVSCLNSSKKNPNDLKINTHENNSDEYVLIEFAAKLEEDYFRFEKLSSP